jgi:hypothetical protein
LPKGNYNVHYNSKDLQEFLKRYKAQAPAKTRSVTSQFGELAATARAFILKRIQDGYPNPRMGAFMAQRTKVEHKITGSSIIFSVSGKKEGELGQDAKPGTKPGTSLWDYHEKSKTSAGPVSGQIIIFEKDEGGGAKRIRQGRKGVSSGRYAGAIAAIINDAAAELFAALDGVAAMIAVSTEATSIRRASAGRINIDSSARGALSGAGISNSVLRELGVTRVFVSATGQINLMGDSPGGMKRFVSGKKHGIPTKIKKGSRAKFKR